MIQVNSQVYIKCWGFFFRYFWSYIYWMLKKYSFFFQNDLRFYEDLFSLFEKREKYNYFYAVLTTLTFLYGAPMKQLSF